MHAGVYACWIYACWCVCMLVCKHACVCILVCMCQYVCMLVCKHACVCMLVCMCRCVCASVIACWCVCAIVYVLVCICQCDCMLVCMHAGGSAGPDQGEDRCQRGVSADVDHGQNFWKLTFTRGYVEHSGGTRLHTHTCTHTLDDRDCHADHDQHDIRPQVTFISVVLHCSDIISLYQSY